MYSLSYRQTQSYTEHRGTVKMTELEETPISIVYETSRQCNGHSWKM